MAAELDTARAELLMAAEDVNLNDKLTNVCREHYDYLQARKEQLDERRWKVWDAVPIGEQHTVSARFSGNPI